jgi:hypothetical protein
LPGFRIQRDLGHEGFQLREERCGVIEMHGQVENLLDSLAGQGFDLTAVLGGEGMGEIQDDHTSMIPP